ncbi:MAG TPA: hypothetical protein PLK63_09415 [Catalimonadaceae bacterium]|nr:hypothetical protein [Catalimonadaceae bacterium]
MGRTTIIGTLFTIISLASIPTFVLPLATMIPFALPIELFFSRVFDHANYNRTGYSVIAILSVLCLVTTYLFFNRFIKDITAKGKINVITFTAFLSVQLFIIHPLFFYIETSKNWSRAGDGQFIFGIAATFPISSFVFLLFGVLTDILQRTIWAKLKTEAKSER